MKGAHVPRLFEPDFFMVMKTQKKPNKSISKRKLSSEKDLEKKIEHFLKGGKKVKSSALGAKMKMKKLFSFSAFLRRSREQRHIEKVLSFFKLETKKFSIRFSFSPLKKIVSKVFSRKTKFMALAVVLVLALITAVFFRKYIASAATFTWIQSSWSGGAKSHTEYCTGNHQINEVEM